MSAKEQPGALQAGQAHANHRPDPRPHSLERALRRRTGGRQPAGIILLVVLVLLALFTMLLISFVVTTVANRQSVLQSTRFEQTGDSPQSQLYDVFMQVARGPRDSNSVIGPHSLLEDIYGHNAGATGLKTTQVYQQGVRGAIMYTAAGPSFVKNGALNTPIIQFQVNSYSVDSTNGLTDLTFLASDVAPFSSDVPPYGYYSGRLMTMLTGPAAGRTAQIVGYAYNSGNTTHTFQTLTFDGLLPNPGDRFLINGRPFSGTGFGFRPLSFMSGITDPGGPHPWVSNSTPSAPATRLLDACDPSGPTPSYYATTALSNPAPNAATQYGFQYALLPNPRRGVFTPFDQTLPAGAPNIPTSVTKAGSYFDPAGPGGANEDYDAPDFQNMMLAMRIWGVPPINPLPTNPVYQLWTPLPSLHRPDLLSYWNTRWKSQGLTVTSSNLLPDAKTSNSNTNYIMARNLLRKATLRPLSFQDDPTTTIDESENPNFTGSNAYLSSANPILSPYDPAGGTPFAMKNLLYGPWDVDNDGDGTPDSVWVDVGFPVQTAPDGRRYKPLAAILCIDMDGKLNLNAHSNWRHPPSNSPGVSRFIKVNAPFARNDPTSTTASYSLKIGSGYGPPEISLNPVLEPGVDNTSGSILNPTQEMAKLFGGDTSLVPPLEGRYGEIGIAPALQAQTPPSSPAAGWTEIDDPMSWLRELDYPQITSFGNSVFPQFEHIYLPTTAAFGMAAGFSLDPSLFVSGFSSPWSLRSNFGTPNDLDGDGMLALDLRGQPMYIDFPALINDNYAGGSGFGEHNDTIDDAYELDLSLQANNDGYSGNIPTVFQNFSSNYLRNSGNTNNIVSVDAPFTPAELERILRWRDGDAPALPDRLTMLAPLAFTSQNPLLASNGISNRYPNLPELAQMPNLLTTASFDVPAPNMIFTAPEQATVLNTYRSATPYISVPPMVNSHISQLVAARIREYTVGVYNAQHADLSISQLLAPEVIGGEKMNVNRILGNGRDDSVPPNNMVDEPSEAGSEAAWGKATSLGSDIPFDLNNDGVAQYYLTTATASPGVSATTADDGKARQLMARYLYVLMMLLKDDNFQVFSDVDGDGYVAPVGNPTITPQGSRDVAYYLAQWAINIVDFRDSDAIMTAFEFDISPFYDDNTLANDGTWDVDGVINPYTGGGTSPDDTMAYRGLVWGAERPELLITETLASHDRRTRDTDKDSTANFIKSLNSMDTNFDQVRRPQGSLIIELHNPNQPLAIGNRLAGQAPNELYSYTGTTDTSGAPMFGLDLGKLAGGTGVPVWRLAMLSNAAADLLQPLPSTPGYPAFLPARQPVLPYPNISPKFPWPNQGIPGYGGGSSPAPPAPQNMTLMIGNTTISSPVNPAKPFPAAAGMPIIDRVAFFTQQPTTTTNIPSTTNSKLDVEAWRQFYAQSGVTNVIVPPGRYAVVAPAAIVASPAPPDPYLPTGSPTGIFTALGARSFSGDSDTTGQTYPTTIKDTYAQRILIDPSIPVPSVRIYGDANSTYFGAYHTSPPGMDIKPPIAIPMAPLAFIGSSITSLASTYGNGGTQYQTATQLARFSVSEPSAGYPSGQARIGSAPSWDENGYYATPVNTPYDDPAATYFTGSGDPLDTRRRQEITGIWQRGTNVAGGPPMSCDSTQLQYTLVCLQRLADPTSQWDAHANPYITVDQMWVDLTTYSSEKYPIMKSPAIRDPEYPSAPVPPANPQFRFDTRQRGGQLVSPTPGWTYNNLWSSYGAAPASGGIGQGANLGNGLPLPNATLGYLNAYYGWGNARNPASGQPTSPYFHKQGGNTAQPQAPTSTENINTDDYLGDPTYPFPWLNWNNRPYVSAKEMMLVPTGSAHSMLNEMTVGQPGPIVTAEGGSPVYWPGAFLNNTPPAYGAFEAQPSTAQPANGMPMSEFGHLPNVFSSPQFDPTSTNTNGRGVGQASANLYRLFEYVHVPSRFTGTETWFPPGAMQNNPTTATNLPVHLFHPPFNRVSRFRDPGKVNINTIFDQFVWQGIVDEPNSALGRTPFWRNMWNSICASRFGLQGQYMAMDTFTVGGITNTAYLQTYLNILEGAAPTSTNGWPSIFRAPFRSYSGHTLVPVDNMRRAPSSTAVEREIDSTLLRTSPTQATYPLLEYPGWSDPTNTTFGFWWDNSTNPQPAMNDPYRNPYFAYRDMRRLDNLLTTRSNVYAVWITLGYFEVSPAPSNDPQRTVKYPDGWVLGQEVGSDTGDIKRHRAFYMYDRSIPVGFERGENHNVQKGILLERYIE